MATFFYNGNNGGIPSLDLKTVLKAAFKHSSMNMRIIYANVAVYCVIKIIYVILYLFDIQHVKLTIENNLGIHASYPVLLEKFWTPITHMFTHLNFWHLFFNCIWLAIFGSMFQRILSQKQLLMLYIFGGLFGALAFVLAYNYIPSFMQYMPVAIGFGASAAVMAIVFAVCFYKPTDEMYVILLGPTKLIYIAIGICIIDLISISSENPGSNIAHLGGALFGVAYALIYKQFLAKKGSTQYTSPSGSGIGDSADEVDRILEKVSQSGYESLSPEEKTKLFKHNS